MDHHRLLLYPAAVYLLYVVWVITSGEYTARRHAWFLGFRLPGMFDESETVSRDEEPFRFWCKVGFDLLIIAGMVAVGLGIGQAGAR